MRCLQNQCNPTLLSKKQLGCLSSVWGVHYFTLLTDDKHLVGKGANAMIGKLQRIHNFTLFAASPSPAPRQSVVDDRAPQIMDWDVRSKESLSNDALEDVKVWKCEAVMESSLMTHQWAHLPIILEWMVQFWTAESLTVFTKGTFRQLEVDGLQCRILQKSPKTIKIQILVLSEPICP